MRHFLCLVFVLAIACFLAGVLIFAPSKRERRWPNSEVPSLPAAPVGTTSQLTRMLQNKIRFVQACVFAGKADVVVESIHPTLIEMMGGREQAYALMSQHLESLRVTEMTLKSLEFHDEPQLFLENEQHYAIVPFTTVLEVDGILVEDVRYYLAIKDSSDTPWTFIDASKQPVSFITTLFPNFPSTAKLPQYETRVLH